jgi:DNA-binding response OmpR family regulator
VSEPVVIDEPDRKPEPSVSEPVAAPESDEALEAAPEWTPTPLTDLGLEQMECTRTLRILIADDDDLICQMLKEALSHKDFHIWTAREAKSIEAVIKQRDAFQLVVLDYVLPGLQPEEVLAWLHEFQPDAAIIMITGFPTIEGAQSAIRARVHDYITKPFPLAQLRHTVMKCLHEKGLLRMTEQALREAVGAAVRERRKAINITLAELSRRSGKGTAFLSQIELGKSAASVETLYKISLALRMPLADLFEFVHVG